MGNEKMVGDLARAGEAMVESRKRKREGKDSGGGRGKAARAKTNGNMKGRGASQPSQPSRTNAVPGFEGQNGRGVSPGAGSSAREMPGQASEPAVPASAAAPASTASAAAAPRVAVTVAPEARAAAEQRSGDGKTFQVLALPSAEARGHTGYLTFARRLVEFAEP